MASPATGELPPLEHDPDDVRRLAQEILSGGEYTPPRRSWLERALDWLARQLDRLFDGDGGGLGGGGGTGGSSLVTIVVLVAASVLVGFLLWRWRRPGGRSRATAAVDIEVGSDRSPEEWQAAAGRAEAAGDWKEGLRCRFGALVGRLLAAGAVSPVPGRTAGELRGDVRESVPDAADDFAAAAALFEQAWYGDVPTGPGEAERFGAHAARVVEAERRAGERTGRVPEAGGVGR